MFSFLKRKNRSSGHNSSPDDTREYILQTVSFLLEGKDNIRLDDVRVTKTGQAIVVIQIPTTQGAAVANSLRKDIEAEVGKITGIEKVTVVVTTAEPIPKRETATVQTKVPPVDHIIAVSSGKGGVGKSTVAVNIALALAGMGKKVGILDADIYGPSIPRLMGVSKRKTTQGQDGRIEPVEAHGIKVMSMGFMVDEESPMIWRGPMVQSALLQMVRDVNWDGIDVLVIDLPPGTGDIHLTLAQRISLSGGVVVSTPQDIALIDARKGLEMFRKVAVPVLGIVENMSYYLCPNCGNREEIFGHGGARAEAAKLGVPFLGEIPLHATIRLLSDAGTPVSRFATERELVRSFQDIAEQILKGIGDAKRPAPRILFED